MEGKSYWVAFKYEKLALFCFNCGRIVHGPRGCPVPKHTSRSRAEENTQWRPWLRAKDPNRKGGSGAFSYKVGEGRSWASETSHKGSGDRGAQGYPNREGGTHPGNSRQAVLETDSEESVAFHSRNQGERDSRGKFNGSNDRDLRDERVERTETPLIAARARGPTSEMGLTNGLQEGPNNRGEQTGTIKGASRVFGPEETTRMDVIYEDRTEASMGLAEKEHQKDGSNRKNIGFKK